MVTVKCRFGSAEPTWSDVIGWYASLSCVLCEAIDLETGRVEGRSLDKTACVESSQGMLS